MLDYIKIHYLELIATITALIYLYYSIKVDKRLWLYGFISSALYVFICYQSGIYADMGINMYYVLISIYGWIHWTWFSQKQKKEVPISFTKAPEWIIIILSFVVLYGVIAYVLIHFTDSTIPYLDSFTTAASILATWMLARKMIEHWLIWIAVDGASVGLYYYKQLYPSTVLFTVYTIMAVAGWIQWKKQWNDQKIKL